MPLWLILLGGAALVWMWKSASSSTAIVQGALKYTVNAPSSYYTSDPTTAQGVAAAGSFPAGTVVYSTAAADGVFSNDSSYELVQQSGSTPVWVQTSALTQSQ